MQAFFFDDARGELAPLTDLRPACAIRTGALTSIERLDRALKLTIVGVQVPAHLEALARENLILRAHPINSPLNAPEGSARSGTPGSDEILFVNSRCALPHKEIESLKQGECVREGTTNDLIAARGRVADIEGFLHHSPPTFRVAAEIACPALLSRPWHVKTFRDRCLAIDLAILSRIVSVRDIPGVHVITKPSRPGYPLESNAYPSINALAQVYPTVTFDIEHGPVVVDQHAVIRPHALIVGPAYIGPHSTVLDKALIKGNTAIGPNCKIAGEVGGTIFQGFANKAHDGHLGDSYIGEWANLGAGTTNSNLLNTYGEVVCRAAPGGSNERTGERFLGCIVGDHAKFAIGTRIMTGAVIHTGTMWAASAPVSGCIAPFSWVTDAGTKAFRFDKFFEIARTVMKRRLVEPTAAYEARLRAIAMTPG